MALSILNNISSLSAQNQLNITGTNLTKTLQQLSSGSKINTGADDAAGLAIADGLNANVTALTRSVQNATDGIGMLQTADGALSQVTALLNRAVTLATEGANGTIGQSQSDALQTEFKSIVDEINSIGTNTKFNSSAVFGTTAAPNTLNVFMSDGTTDNAMSTSVDIAQLSASKIGLTTNTPTAATGTITASGALTANDTVTVGGATYKFVTTLTASTTSGEVLLGADQTASMKNLADAINQTAGSGTTWGSLTPANANVSAVATGASVTFTAKGAGNAGAAGNLVGLSESSTSLAVTGGGTTLGGGSDTKVVDLSSTADAQAALKAINSAVAAVAAQRGTLGATVNKLQAATSVMNTQVQNLTSSIDGITAADIGKQVAQMTKFNILQQTGIAALQQSNQAQQSVLKLLQ